MFELDAEALKQGQRLFQRECTFVAGVANHDAMPPDDGMPEIAFAGRSNVGKSSLINAVTGRKALARASKTPGRTQQINFFEIDGQFRLVDLPGYGYAKESKTKVAAWNVLIRDYLTHRRSLRRVCVLIDSRHGILAADRESMEILDRAGVRYVVVLTKADKPKAAELAATVRLVQEDLQTRHVAAYGQVFATSADKNIGIAELRAILHQIKDQE
ncbi:MAG TPA: ribosome biogenesis GTP-binding protein YihA/YsxC [Patescibacteria group bacterium]|nr:ribosome biogenesis GTP-binding protein YihA/YsxC [Patescibacteria group bacterium]